MAENTLTDFPRTAEVLERYAREFIEAYKLALVESGRPASGRLSNSLNYSVSVNGSTFAVDISLAHYWKYIEDGTRPHFPPIEAIRQWIAVKPVVPRPDSRGRVPSEQQLAFLIARKISRVGTEGTHDLRRSNEDIFSQMQESIAAAITEDIESQVDIIFTHFNPR